MISLEKNLKKIFSEVFQLNENKIISTSGYKNIKKWDSLSHVKLIMVIERKFKISIDPEESLEFISFGQILRYLKKKKNI
jgi:acyl carrier protein